MIFKKLKDLLFNNDDGCSGNDTVEKGNDNNCPSRNNSVISEKYIFDFYEKLYFHEIETSDRLNNMLQLPFALIVSMVGVLIFILQSYDRSIESTWASLFSLCFFYSCLSLVLGVYFFIKAAHGNVYALLPVSNETKKYRESLIEYYKEHENAEELINTALEKYLHDIYIKCASKNTKCNDKRSNFLHNANNFLIATVTLTAITFMFFFFGNLDKVHKVEILDSISTISIKEQNMPEDNDNLPPPPPPKERLIKDGVEIMEKLNNEE